MRTARELLSQYAEYHRDRRNIATHFVGIPLIVFSVAELLARIRLGGTDSMWSVACVMWILTTAFYLRRHLIIGVATSLAVGLAVWLGDSFSHASFSTWLAVGVGSFVIGWIIQFIGHYYEGKKPAFVDDLTGLLIGPMFVVAEVVFALGLCGDLHQHIESKAGPTYLRDLSRA